jgi:hypothetical protein
MQSRIDVALKIALSFAALLAGSAVAYHYAIYLPSKDEDQRTQRIETAEQARSEYDMCLVQAEIKKSQGWDVDCEHFGRGESCFLPEFNVNRWETFLERRKDTCLDEYRLKIGAR